MELVFEITFYQQTRARRQTFEGIADSKRQPVPAGQLWPYLVYFGPSMTNHLNIPKTKLMGALLVASGLLNIMYRNVHPY